jgi:hypothetical protein
MDRRKNEHVRPAINTLKTGDCNKMSVGDWLEETQDSSASPAAAGEAEA